MFFYVSWRSMDYPSPLIRSVPFSFTFRVFDVGRNHELLSFHHWRRPCLTPSLLLNTYCSLFYSLTHIQTFGVVLRRWDTLPTVTSRNSFPHCTELRRSSRRADDVVLIWRLRSCLWPSGPLWQINLIFLIIIVTEPTETIVTFPTLHKSNTYINIISVIIHQYIPSHTLFLILSSYWSLILRVINSTRSKSHFVQTPYFSPRVKSRTL